MSMLDGFFNKGGFKGAKCKTLLKLTIPRIKLLRNRREIQLKQMRRDIAKLLENGQEATARIRVEHIIREENMMAAQEILELFCELIAVRLPIIETQRECPLDLKEAISSVCFAAPRCSDLPELQQVHMLFAAKYGKEFVAAATELMPDCGVNRQIVELLSVRAPSVETKLKLLKEIAEEHELEWDPAASETEFLKPHEDLLNGPGPSHITGGSSLPLPKEKHGDMTSSISSKPSEEYDSDTGFDSLDLPEVPKVSVRATPDIPSAPGLTSPRPHSPPHHIDLDSEITKSRLTHAEPQVDNQDHSAPVDENKQFQYIPFVASPPPIPFPVRQSDPTLSLPHDANPSLPRIPREPTPSSSHPKPESNADWQAALAAAQAAADTAERAAAASPKPESNADLQDVLAAAQAAADSAERAAAAARAAASLAHVRITELINRKNVSRVSDSDEQNNLYETSDQQNVAGNPNFDQQNSLGRAGHFPVYEPAWNVNSPLSPENLDKREDGSPDSRVQGHQPQRSTSLEDDPYFAYPNLFSRQDSGINPSPHSSA